MKKLELTVDGKRYVVGSEEYPKCPYIYISLPDENEMSTLGFSYADDKIATFFDELQSAENEIRIRVIDCEEEQEPLEIYENEEDLSLLEKFKNMFRR